MYAVDVKLVLSADIANGMQLTFRALRVPSARFDREPGWRRSEVKIGRSAE